MLGKCAITARVEPAVIIIFLALPLLAYFVKGIVGAASAIVFNAILLFLIAFGANGSVTLVDGLLWVGLVDTVSSISMALMLRKQLRLEKPVMLLLAGMLPVIVAFSLLLKRLDLGVLTAVLAAAVVLAGLWLVLRPNPDPLSEKTANGVAFPLGVVSGVLSGLFAMAGPVVILYLAAGSNDPNVIRRRLVLISTCATITRTITLAADGEYNEQRMTWVLWSLPSVFAGLAAGIAVYRFVSPKVFRLALGLLVLLAGLAAAIKSIVA
ncbi:MAG: TSUP family transporter [Planctomycetes bacterium]|nr:TSUP family transporter [Planctomycetota bacterium]